MPTTLESTLVEWFEINSIHIFIPISLLRWVPARHETFDIHVYHTVDLCGKRHEKNVFPRITETWNIAFHNNVGSIKVHEPQGTYLPLKWEPPPTPRTLKRGTPLVPVFTDTVTGRVWSTDRQTPHISQSQRACGFSFRSTPAPRRPGASLPQCGIRARAGTGYCASSVHEKNTSPQPTQDELCAVRPGEAESSEVGGQKRKLAKLVCGIKELRSFNKKWVEEILCGLKLLIIILRTCAAKLCSNPQNCNSIREESPNFQGYLIRQALFGGNMYKMLHKSSKIFPFMSFV